MSLDALRRPRLALRTLDRAGRLSVILSSARVARLAERDCEAHRQREEMCRCGAVLRDMALDRDGRLMYSTPYLADRAKESRDPDLRALGLQYKAAYRAWQAAAVSMSVGTLAPAQSPRRLCRWEQL